MRSEYDFSGAAVVGKYAKRYREGPNVVPHNPVAAELQRCFWVALDKPY
jgi:hypothetical protein